MEGPDFFGRRQENLMKARECEGTSASARLMAAGESRGARYRLGRGENRNGVRWKVAEILPIEAA